MSINTGRKKDANRIRRANRAAAVGRLMLGELTSWHSFLEADVIDLEAMPRRRLKAGKADVKTRLSPEIANFCSGNFQGMSEKKLSLLYEEIKAFRGLEMPLLKFEKQFASVKREVLKGQPKHLTVTISLWGLQFLYPEAEITKDLIEALEIADESQVELNKYEVKSHVKLTQNRDQIGILTRRKNFAVRSAVTCCFNLVEAYLNGLAWDFVATYGTANLSNRKTKLLEDLTSVSTRDKLYKYPEVLTGKPLWGEPDIELEGFVNTVKPFRDSLMHPSPFSAPAKFGGYDKLRLFYRVDYDTSVLAARLAINLIKRINHHVYGNDTKFPYWINDLETQVKKVSENLNTMRDIKFGGSFKPENDPNNAFAADR